MLTCWFTQKEETSGQGFGSVTGTTNTSGQHKGVLFCLTFTVSRVGVELEASLTQAQERSIGVEALSTDTHILFAAFVHI